jgi:cytochrome b
LAVSADPATPRSGRPALVWDWPLRVFHWALVLAVAISFATHYLGVEWFDWHRRAGYVTLVLVGFRLAWGLVGSRHARFASFLRGPGAMLDYLQGRQPYPVAGHNPLGGLSVVIFLVALAVQAATGLFANDEIANAGPFYGWITQEVSNRLTALHEINANVLLALIVAHVAAVIWYDAVRGRGLTRAFVTGRKPGATDIESSRGGLAVGIVIALVIALALAVRAAPEATVSFF